MEKWLSQTYLLTLALNSGPTNTYLRSPTQGLLEEVGPKERGAQGRGGSSPGVAWKSVLQIYVSRGTGSAGDIACQPGALGDGVQLHRFLAWRDGIFSGSSKVSVL